MLSGEGVTKRFGGLMALKGIDFRVEKGEIFGLIGPNGAGKTTLVNIISGIQRPNSGRVLFDGVNLCALRPDEICRLGIGRTFQLVQSFPTLTVLQNTMVGALFGKKGVKRRREEARERALQVLEFVGLAEKVDAEAKSLNVAELKRLDLARALAAEPELLMLDEINTGLNPTESNEAVELIREIRDQGVTILIVEHLMRIIMNLCDRVMVLNYGQKIAEGTPEEISSDEEVVRVYLGEAVSKGAVG